MLDVSTFQGSGSSFYHDPSTNAARVSAFDPLHEQYAMVCLPHSHKTRIFSIDPFIIYLESYITAPEREYIVNIVESQYTKSEVPELATGGYVNTMAPEYRPSQTASFFEDPVSQCIEERSAFFQGNVPVERVGDLQVVKYRVSDHHQHYWNWWEGADYSRVSTLFACLACDSGESENGEQCDSGATQFPNLRNDYSPEWFDVIDCNDDNRSGGVSFKPVPGNAIFWSNVRLNNTYHRGTSHASMAVKKGQEIELNIWIN